MRYLLASALAAGLFLSPALTSAQDFVLDGYHDCARATNGRAYCKRGTSDNYFPVPDTFLSRFEAARAGGGRPVVQNNITNNTVVVANLTSDAAEARGMIALFNAIIGEQRRIAASNSDLSDVAAQAIAVLQTRIDGLKSRFSDKTTELSHYQTSIRPNDPDLQISARKASELYPKVPYYIPGTPETGEFWMEPVVTDNGELAFNLRFIDPKSENDKTRETITLNSTQLEASQKALAHVVQWAKIAHDKHVRRDLVRRATCFPDANCPAEGGPKRDGLASTEIDFKIYEDGSTAGRIQRNKGRFEYGYNVSIDSALLLQAYFNHVLNEGKTDFEAGSRTDDQLKELFK